MLDLARVGCIHRAKSALLERTRVINVDLHDLVPRGPGSGPTQIRKLGIQLLEPIIPVLRHQIATARQYQANPSALTRAREREFTDEFLLRHLRRCSSTSRLSWACRLATLPRRLAWGSRWRRLYGWALPSSDRLWQGVDAQEVPHQHRRSIQQLGPWRRYSEALLHQPVVPFILSEQLSSHEQAGIEGTGVVQEGHALDILATLQSYVPQYQSGPHPGRLPVQYDLQHRPGFFWPSRPPVSLTDDKSLDWMV